MFRICRRIWNEAKQQRFSSFENLNSWLEARYRALWPEIQHPDYVGITLVDALEQEQLFLMPMPAPFDGYIEVLAGVSSTFLVTLLHNRYFPCLAVWPIKWLPFIGMSTVSRLFMTILWQPVIPVCWIVTRLAMTGSTIFRSSRKSRALYATAHRLQNYRHPCCNCRLHCGVESANKLIESWQSAQPGQRMDWKLVLESGVPSAEHVSNVLTRLKHTNVPASVETTLRLKEEPQADTASYDPLNAKEVPHV